MIKIMSIARGGIKAAALSYDGQGSLLREMKKRVSRS